jgi:hypothetical protein
MKAKPPWQFRAHAPDWAYNRLSGDFRGTPILPVGAPRTSGIARVRFALGGKAKRPRVGR